MKSESAVTKYDNYITEVNKQLAEAMSQTERIPELLKASQMSFDDFCKASGINPEVYKLKPGTIVIVAHIDHGVGIGCVQEQSKNPHGIRANIAFKYGATMPNTDLSNVKYICSMEMPENVKTAIVTKLYELNNKREQNEIEILAEQCPRPGCEHVRASPFDSRCKCGMSYKTHTDEGRYTY